MNSVGCQPMPTRARPRSARAGHAILWRSRRVRGRPRTRSPCRRAHGEIFVERSCCDAAAQRNCRFRCRLRFATISNPSFTFFFRPSISISRYARRLWRSILTIEPAWPNRGAVEDRPRRLRSRHQDSSTVRLPGWVNVVEATSRSSEEVNISSLPKSRVNRGTLLSSPSQLRVLGHPRTHGSREQHTAGALYPRALDALHHFVTGDRHDSKIKLRSASRHQTVLITPGHDRLDPRTTCAPPPFGLVPQGLNKIASP